MKSHLEEEESYKWNEICNDVLKMEEEFIETVPVKEESDFASDIFEDGFFNLEDGNPGDLSEKKKFSSYDRVKRKRRHDPFFTNHIPWSESSSPLNHRRTYPRKKARSQHIQPQTTKIFTKRDFFSRESYSKESSITCNVLECYPLPKQEKNVDWIQEVFN